MSHQTIEGVLKEINANLGKIVGWSHVSTTTPFYVPQLEKWLIAEGHCTKEDFPKLLAELSEHPFGICPQGNNEEKPQTEDSGKKEPTPYILKPQPKFLQIEKRKIISAATVEGLVFSIAFNTSEQTDISRIVLAHSKCVDDEVLIDSITLAFDRIFSGKFDSSKIDDVEMVQFRLSGILKAWIDFDWNSIRLNKSVLHKVKSLIDLISRKCPMIGIDLTKQFRSAMSGIHLMGKTAENPPPTIVPKPPKPNKEWSITDIDPEEFARQLTLIDQDALMNIPLSEYFALKDKNVPTPLRDEYISKIARLSGWLAGIIVREQKLKTRVKNLAHVIEIGRHLLHLNNFNSLHMIYVALEMSPTQRLSKTWKELPKNSATVWAKIQQIMNPELDFEGYKVLKKERMPPFIPCQDCFKRELIEADSAPDFIEKNIGVINFQKLDNVGEFLWEVKSVMQKPFNFRVEESIEDLLKTVPLIRSDILQKASLLVEPPPGSRPPAKKGFRNSIAGGETPRIRERSSSRSHDKLSSPPPSERSDRSGKHDSDKSSKERSGGSSQRSTRDKDKSSDTGQEEDAGPTITKPALAFETSGPPPSDDLDSSFQTMLLKSTYNKERFKAYLDIELKSHYFKFWEEVQAFINEPHFETATKIVATFITASVSLPLTEEMKKAILDELKRAEQLLEEDNAKKGIKKKLEGARIVSDTPLEKQKWLADKNIFSAANDLILKLMEDQYQAYLVVRNDEFPSKVKKFSSIVEFFEKQTETSKVVIVVFYRNDPVSRAYIKEWNHLLSKVPASTLLFAVSTGTDHGATVLKGDSTNSPLFIRWDLQLGLALDPENHLAQTFGVHIHDNGAFPAVIVQSGKKVLYKWIHSRKMGVDSFPDPVDIWTFCVLPIKKPDFTTLIKQGNPITFEGWSPLNRKSATGSYSDTSLTSVPVKFQGISLRQVVDESGVKSTREEQTPISPRSQRASIIRQSDSTVLDIGPRSEQGSSKSRQRGSIHTKSPPKIGISTEDDETVSFLAKLSKGKLTIEDVSYFQEDLSRTGFEGVIPFVNSGGILELLKLISKPAWKKNTVDEKLIALQQAALSLIGAIITVPKGWAAVIDTNTLFTLCQILHSKDIQIIMVKSLLDLLAACCLIPGGHLVVLQAFRDNVQSDATGKPIPLFGHIVMAMTFKFATVEFVTSDMGFINSLINANQDLETRCKVRDYFIRLGLPKMITDFKNQFLSGDLHIQLDLFTETAEKDAKETEERLEKAKEAEKQDVPSTPAEIMAHTELLLQGTSFYNSFFYSINQINSIQSSKAVGREVWAIIENVLRTIQSLEKKGMPSHEVADEIVARLRNKKPAAGASSHTTSTGLFAGLKDKSPTKDKDKEKDRSPRKGAQVDTAWRLNVDEEINQMKGLVVNVTAENNKLRNKIADLEYNLNIYEEGYYQKEAELKSLLKGDLASLKNYKTEDYQLQIEAAGSKLMKEEKDKLGQGKPSMTPTALPRGGPAPMTGIQGLPGTDTTKDEPKTGAPLPRGGPPPPGVRGGPPPPPGARGGPPPPGMRGGPQMPKLPNPKIATKMKLFNWTKIPDQKIPKTWWEPSKEDLNKKYEPTDIYPTEGVNLNHLKLEDEFAAKVFEKKEEVAPKKQLVSLLDDKRSKNLAIMLQSRFKKLTMNDIKSAVLSLDSSVLMPGDVTALKEFIPTQEELEALNSYSGPLDELPPPERYFLAIKDVPSYYERLCVWEYKLLFDELVSDVHPFITTAYFALRQVKTSEKLRGLFKLILKIGNYMNAGTARGGAYGYKLETLEKLRDTKTTDNSHTLLHFLVQSLSKENSELQFWPEQLQSVSEATKVSMDLLKPRIGQLKQGLNVTSTALKTMAPTDTFVTIMKPFLEEATQGVAVVESDFSRLEKEYHSFLEMWQEDEKSLPLQQIFLIVDKFINEFKEAEKALIEEKEAMEKAAAAAEKKAEAERAAAEKKLQKKDSKTSITILDDSGSVDSLQSLTSQHLSKSLARGKKSSKVSKETLQPLAEESPQPQRPKFHKKEEK